MMLTYHATYRKFTTTKIPTRWPGGLRLLLARWYAPGYIRLPACGCAAWVGVNVRVVPKLFIIISEKTLNFLSQLVKVYFEKSFATGERLPNIHPLQSDGAGSLGFGAGPLLTWYQTKVVIFSRFERIYNLWVTHENLEFS